MTHPFLEDPGRVDSDPEQLADGGTWLLDVVAAVDFLRRGHRPGFTVWDAIEEALRLAYSDVEDDTGSSTDPLAVAMLGFASSTSDAPAHLQTAVRRWVAAMADRFNDGQHWPHPAARRGFPPPATTITEE